MQTPTPYEQREHQLCFFFIQLNRQVSSVRKKSQCAFYVVICLPAPRANETKVVLFLKKTKSASPFCLYSSRHLCSPWHFARRHSVIPRHDAESRNTRAWHNSGRTSHAALLHPLPPRSWPLRRVRGDTVRITCGVTQSPHRMQSAPLPQKKYTHSLKKYSEIFGLYYKPIYICSINTFQGETI